jgi:hypothetical protein
LCVGPMRPDALPRLSSHIVCVWEKLKLTCNIVATCTDQCSNAHVHTTSTTRHAQSHRATRRTSRSSRSALRTWPRLSRPRSIGGQTDLSLPPRTKVPAPPPTPTHPCTNTLYPPYPHQPTPRTLARAQVLTGIVGRLGGLPQQRGNTHASEATVRSPPMPSLVTPIDSSVGRRHRFPMLHTCTHAHTRSHTLAHANTSSHNTHAHAHTHRTQRVVQLPCRPSQLFRGGTRRLHWMGP